jgi:hypothetical protein
MIYNFFVSVFISLNYIVDNDEQNVWLARKALTCAYLTSMSMLLKASHSPTLVLQNADKGTSSPK